MQYISLVYSRYNLARPIGAILFSLYSDTFRLKKDLLRLVSLGDSLEKLSSAIGFYKVQESTENIKYYAAVMNEDCSPLESDERCLHRIKDEIGSLKDMLYFARTAFDRFYRDISGEHKDDA